MKRLLLIAITFIALGCWAQLPVIPPALQAPAPFDPRSVSGLVMWLCITNGLTNNAGINPPSNNDRIQGWADLSGNGNYVTKSGGSTVQPTYKSTGGPNGGPYIFFTHSTGESLTNALAGTHNKAQPNIEFWVVYWAGEDGSYNSANGAQMNGAADQSSGQLQVNGNSLSMYNNGLAAGCGLCYGQQFPYWEVSTFSWNGASCVARTNGVATALSSTTTGTLAQNGITLGNYFNSLISGEPEIAEFLWYSGNNMSVGTMHQIELYLGQKYGLPVQ